MLAPYQVAHSNYKLVEDTIDAMLRANDYREGGCLIPMRRAWNEVVLENLLFQYKTAGWTIESLTFPLVTEEGLPDEQKFAEVVERYSVPADILKGYHGRFLGYVMPDTLMPETNPVVGRYT